MPGVSEATEAAAPCELLEWDSEHFGFPIGRVVGETLTAQSAEEIDDWCSDQGIRCLYFLAAVEDAGTAQVAGGCGYRVVDARITIGRSLEGIDRLPLSGPEGMEIREASERDLDDLLALAARSHHGSRFYFDGRFSRERCDALYQAWVERALRDPDRILRVSVIDGKPVGYIVFAARAAGRESRGELVAVDERHRGKGVGQALHVSMYRLLAARGALSHRGVISFRNLANMRLHERLGFLTEKIEVWHHKWYGGSTVD